MRCEIALTITGLVAAAGCSFTVLPIRSGSSAASACSGAQLVPAVLTAETIGAAALAVAPFGGAAQIGGWYAPQASGTACLSVVSQDGGSAVVPTCAPFALCAPPAVYGYATLATTTVTTTTTAAVTNARTVTSGAVTTTKTETLTVRPSTTYAALPTGSVWNADGTYAFVNEPGPLGGAEDVCARHGMRLAYVSDVAALGLADGVRTFLGWIRPEVPSVTPVVLGRWACAGSACSISYALDATDAVDTKNIFCTGGTAGGAAQHVAITGSVVLESTAPPVFRLDDAIATCERHGFVLATLPLGDPGFVLSDNRFTAATPFAWMYASLPSPVRCGQYSAMGSAGSMLMYHTSDACSSGSWGAIRTTLNGN